MLYIAVSERLHVSSTRCNNCRTAQIFSACQL